LLLAREHKLRRLLRGWRLRPSQRRGERHMRRSVPRTEEEVLRDRCAAVGRNVLSLIEAHRMSFAGAAKATGLSKTALYKIADGKSDPCLSSLYAISDFFSVSIADLVAAAPAPGETRHE
jgi:DNA-binding XRE family transcriptional regulator